MKRRIIPALLRFCYSPRLPGTFSGQQERGNMKNDECGSARCVIGARYKL